MDTVVRDSPGLKWSEKFLRRMVYTTLPRNTTYGITLGKFSINLKSEEKQKEQHDL